MRLLLFGLCLLACRPAPAQSELPFAEDFESSWEELAELGWILPPTAWLSDEASGSERCLRVEVTEARDRYA